MGGLCSDAVTMGYVSKFENSQVIFEKKIGMHLTRDPTLKAGMKIHQTNIVHTHN